MKKLFMMLILFLGIQLACFAPKNSYREFNLYHGYNTYIQKEAHEKRISLVLKTIRIIESREHYNIKGASGEYGAYQFMPRTWHSWSNKYFGKLLDITIPDNQDKVASSVINELINKGYSNAEIASVWNCGSTYYKNKRGTNSKGVYYDVPRHVNRFLSVLNKIKKPLDSKYVPKFLLMRNRKVELTAYYNSLKNQEAMAKTITDLRLEYRLTTGESPVKGKTDKDGVDYFEDGPFDNNYTTWLEERYIKAEKTIESLHEEWNKCN